MGLCLHHTEFLNRGERRPVLTRSQNKKAGKRRNKMKNVEMREHLKMFIII